MSKVNVLIFPAGEINSIELHDALSHNVNVEVFGCSSFDRHGGYVFKNYRADLPNIAQDDFLESFNKLLIEWKIDFIFPTHDTVALFLAENQKRIQAKVIVAAYETALICRDKKATYTLFKDCDFCPQQYSDLKKLPVFIKPRFGQGSKGAKLIETIDCLPGDFILDDYTINEYLPGEEVTVDCLTDSKGKLCACLPRIRKRLLAGVCVAGSTILATYEIQKIAREINDRMKFLGLWYFQIKRDINGKFKLLEISSRCAGTMCLSRARGVNLPLLSVYAAQGKAINIFENPFMLKMDRTLISRYSFDYYYNTVYIDYDDTIIEGNSVCLPVIKYLYQCKNKNIKIKILSRHEEDHDDTIEESLNKHAISPNLFDRIVKLTFNDKKSDFICDDNAIFIDNAYAERKEVHERLGIPVFDVEGIEVVEDWRA